MHDAPLAGMHVLVMEDEFLIAMDVEELCREHGAADVTIVRRLDELGGRSIEQEVNVAILDVMLGGTSTTDFARTLTQHRIPFVFATGYTDFEEHLDAGVEVVGKPYSAADLIAALERAMARTNKG